MVLVGALIAGALLIGLVWVRWEVGNWRRIKAASAALEKRGIPTEYGGRRLP